MHKKAVVGVLTVMILLSLCSFMTTFADTDDYALLIIAPMEFLEALEPLRDFKTATGRPTFLLSLEGIGNLPGADDAEKVKRCIAFYESAYGIKYVMLVGDCDKIPMRTHYVRSENATHVTWLAYYLTDHYYADLYNETGGFCDWDYNKNGLYGESIAIEGEPIINIDHVDLEPDVAVGRVPASTVEEVETYVNKVILYETTTSLWSDWFRRILLLTGVDGWCYPGDVTQNDNVADVMQMYRGFEAVKYYDETGYVSPNSTNINEQLNQGVGFVNVISHADPTSWGCYNVLYHMSGLNNTERLPVIYSFGCHAAHFGPIAPFDTYIDINGTTQLGGFEACPKVNFVEPPSPGLLQDNSTDMESMAEYWLVKHEVGGIAFIGSTASATSTWGYPLNTYFFDASVDAQTLGDMWMNMSAEFVANYDPWEAFERWVRMNLFGDPSLLVAQTPSFARDLYGNFRWMKDVPSVTSAKVESASNLGTLEIILEPGVTVVGKLKDPTKDGWVHLEVETATETLHYEFTVKAHARADCWPMHGRDPGHSGFSSSTVPKNNGTRWNYTTSAAIEYSPAVADGMVFLGSSSDMRVLNATTGSLLWQYDVTITSSPAVADGAVFFGTNEGLYALNETSGIPIWRFSTSAPVNSSPVVVNGKVFFGCDDNKVYALNQTNKNVLWNYVADNPVRTSPCVADGMVFVGSQTNMYALNESSGLKIWNFTREVQSSPTIADGIVFFGTSNGPYALNATTGAFIWRYYTSAAVVSSPAVGYGKVFLGCNDLRVYALNETDGNELWNATTDGPVIGSPAIVEDAVIFVQGYTIGDIRSQFTGELLWNFLTSGSILASATAAYGSIFLGDTNGNLYCVGPQFDVATTIVETSKTVVGQGYSVSINVTAQNKGEVTETFYVSALHGGMIDEYPVTLPAEGTDVISIRWNTANTVMGNYSVSGYAEPVPGETSTLDNLLAGGWVIVTIPGDVKGDFVVDIYDAILLAGTYNTGPESTNWNPNTDINDDSTVDIYDAIILASHYNMQYP